MNKRRTAARADSGFVDVADTEQKAVETFFWGSSHENDLQHKDLLHTVADMNLSTLFQEIDDADARLENDELGAGDLTYYSRKVSEAFGSDLGAWVDTIQTSCSTTVWEAACCLGDRLKASDTQDSLLKRLFQKLVLILALTSERIEDPAEIYATSDYFHDEDVKKILGNVVHQVAQHFVDNVLTELSESDDEDDRSTAIASPATAPPPPDSVDEFSNEGAYHIINRAPVDNDPDNLSEGDIRGGKRSKMDGPIR